MALTVSFVDNQDGTATATIAGSDVSSANTVYTCAVSPPNVNTPAWASAGSRTGDGTLTVTAAAGYYYAYCAGTVSSAAALSVPTLFGISAAAQSVQEQVEAAIQARIQQLSLSGLSGGPGDLPSSRVYRLQAATPEALVAAVIYPCIVVATAQVPDTQQGILNNVDDIQYPVNILLLDRVGSAYQANAPTYRLWRQQIFRALRNQRLPNVSTVYTVRLDPEPVLEWEPRAYELMHSGWLARAVSREPRGLGA